MLFNELKILKGEMSRKQSEIKISVKPNLNLLNRIFKILQYYNSDYLSLNKDFFISGDNCFLGAQERKTF